MNDNSDASAQKHKIHEICETDIAPQLGSEADNEQDAIPPGRYLTGVRLVLVGIRSVVLSALHRPALCVQRSKLT